MAPKGMKVKELLPTYRKAAFGMCLLLSKEGLLPRKSYVNLGVSLGVNERRVARLWPDVLSSMEDYLSKYNDLESMGRLIDLTLPLSSFPDEIFNAKKGIVGRKVTYYRELLAVQSKLIPHNKKSTFHSRANKLGVSKSRAYHLLKKEKLFISVTDDLKPFLKPFNKFTRVDWALSNISIASIDTARCS